MSLKESHALLRGATYRADVPEVKRLLQERAWPEQVLQLIGDALLIAVNLWIRQRPGPGKSLRRATAGAGMGRRCRPGRGTRGPGRGWPQPLLKPVGVDLEELASVLESDPTHGGGGVDLATGQVWSQTVFEDFRAGEGDEDEREEEAAGTRWLWVDPVGSRSSYRDMEVFIDTLQDEHLAEVLSTAIIGQGAFRRFKGALARHPDGGRRPLARIQRRPRPRPRPSMVGGPGLHTKSRTNPANVLTSATARRWWRTS